MLPLRPAVRTRRVVLRRDGSSQPWGISLLGGVDLGVPLVISRAQVGSPSEGELERGDVIKKLGDYDSRDLRHEDAQNLFKQAGNTITLVVQREQGQTFSCSSSRSSSVVPAVPSPLTMNPAPKGGVATPFALAAHSPKVSALAAQEFSAARAQSPIVFPPPLPGDEEGEGAALPQPSYHFQQMTAQVHPAYHPSSGGGVAGGGNGGGAGRQSALLAAPRSCVARASSPVVFPPPRPDEVQELVYQAAPPVGRGLQFASPFRATPIDGRHDTLHDDMEIAAIGNQPYRTTPLVLPGAKVKKDQPTESYLRHHPNPLFRAAPAHFDTPADVLMKQKVADTVLQRVAAEEGGKQMVHKQFNSPIGLYSDQNIADSIQDQHSGGAGQPPANVRAPSLNRKNQSKVSLKKTVSYDPAKSETFKALQEDQLGGEMTEVATPAQTKVFSPREGTTRVSGQKTPGAQPYYAKPQNQGQPNTFVNSLGGTDELIHQSGTFKRLMYQVLGEY